MSDGPDVRAAPGGFVLVAADELDEADRAARENGVATQVLNARGLEPVATVTLLLFGGTAAVAAVVQHLEERKGGQVIDLRPGSPRAVYRTKDVVYGTVVVIAGDGTVRVEVKEPTNVFAKVIETLPQTLSSLIGGSSGDVATRVADELGDDVVVATSGAP